MAQDDTGEWCWYQGKPSLGKVGFVLNSGRNLRGCQSARYGEVIGNWQDTLEQRPEPLTAKCATANNLEFGGHAVKGDDGVWTISIKDKEQDMNYLPPVKSTHNDFELVGLGYTNPQFEVTAHHYNGVTAIVSVNTENGVRLHNAKSVHFRPIKSERTDELVEQASELVPPYTNEVAESARKYTIETLVKNGYRKTKPMTEERFVVMTIGKDSHELYRAGCVFLDKGDDHERH